MSYSHIARAAVACAPMSLGASVAAGWDAAWQGRIMKALLLVRHASPQVSDNLATVNWPLTDQGRHDAAELGVALHLRDHPVLIVTSAEQRALETAALLLPGHGFEVRDDLAEVRKPWFAQAEDHRSAVERYLNGTDLAGWESRSAASARFQAALDELDDDAAVVAVTHGTVMTAWLMESVGLVDPFAFWSSLRTPDAWHVELETGEITRIPRATDSSRPDGRT